MKIIRLKDFKDFDFSQIYAAIMTDPCEEYEIHLHKFYLFEKDHYGHFQNYISAAYIGQKLYYVAKTFTYWVPSSIIEDPFIYQVTFCNPEELVDIIDCVISSYVTYRTLVLSVKFISEVERFYCDTLSLKYKFECKGLIDIADVHYKRYVASEKRAARKRRLEKSIKHPYPFLTKK